MATALVMVLGLAVTPARPASADSLYVISGTVFGGERPRAGVFVSDGQRTIVTDASGAFEFERSAPGVVFVSAWLSNGSTRTWVVVLAVPGETVIEFSFPHSLALRGPGLWDPMSTAAGPITRTLRIVTDAPDPGSPGQAGRSCVSVFDSRTSTATPATLSELYWSGLWEWEWDLEFPQSTPEGDYFIDMILTDCGTGARLTDGPVTRSYTIDNTPPSVSDPTPTGWVASSTVVSARVVDAAGSLHPDIDDACFRPVQLWIDGTRYGPEGLACFERRGSPDRLFAPVSGLAHGPHAAEIRAADDAGNIAPPLPFSFAVDAIPPALGAPNPVGVTADRSPSLSLGVDEPDSGLDASSVAMRLSNGVVTSSLDAEYDPGASRITYQVPGSVEGAALGRFPLPDGTYLVEVDVRDQVGNAASFSWSFEVRTLIPG
ncbi:MAG TPA: Ig-like domain repeat protein [Acidimicrobiia bacterium]|nr:Ig-like domain repeat protein [Acidimicrobiia bacterium]